MKMRRTDQKWKNPSNCLLPLLWWWWRRWRKKKSESEKILSSQLSGAQIFSFFWRESCLREELENERNRMMRADWTLDSKSAKKETPHKTTTIFPHYTISYWALVLFQLRWKFPSSFLIPFQHDPFCQNHGWSVKNLNPVTRHMDPSMVLFYILSRVTDSVRGISLPLYSIKKYYNKF